MQAQKNRRFRLMALAYLYWGRQQNHIQTKQTKPRVAKVFDMNYSFFYHLFDFGGQDSGQSPRTFAFVCPVPVYRDF